MYLLKLFNCRSLKKPVATG